MASQEDGGPGGAGARSSADRAERSVSDDVLSLALDYTTDGVLLADEHGDIAYANRSLHRLFGYNDGDLVGQPLDVLIPPESRTRHRSQVKRFHKHRRQRQMGRDDLDIEGRHADGSSIPIDVQLDALPGVQFVLATVRDMAAQRRASVDRAIDQLDLASARTEVTRLHASLDQVIQRLFALGASMTSRGSDDADLTARLSAAVERIDQIIEAVQHGRNPGLGRER